MESVLKKRLINTLLKILNKLGWKPSVTPPRVYVFAANYQHFIHWCRMSGFHPGIATFVDNPQKLYGITIKDNVFIFYETWREHPFARELEHRYLTLQSRDI